MSINLELPKHIAIVMDGNGRWASSKFLPRSSGHLKGLRSLISIVNKCKDIGVSYLTLFAFSSENWKRPAEEVSSLMNLFVNVLEKEINYLVTEGICLHVIGDITAFDSYLQSLIKIAVSKTSANNKLHLTIAANYGGRWDILQAVRSILDQNNSSILSNCDNDYDLFVSYLSMSWAPDPDLFIRTGGESRLSNFLIWQLAYSELYFTDVYWPDFNTIELEKAIKWYKSRERRFGKTSEQLLDGCKG
ncbi:undecaprenyl diphosphate synthase [Candidatus Kinetoplastibacterium desouzaii TCC079E]|uniref:Isoprenyl transferase n=1 Tax=Candidatus Kinetoplastidibacterium desouzai TCC079E TaxID=1208919 RepID=M1L2A1_9PROT|nr:polyprenyl diphosphate synthase [Candidatus Kinetoplastibacterium desouzaii]AGF46878.1 undecaprenyl diphosphate synthase [Candidatus Kinetoplastibacterium desouzaii TCC079E]